MSVVTKDYSPALALVEIRNGKLWWKARGDAAFDARYAGAEVRGRVDRYGYQIVTIKGLGAFRYHVLLWTLHHGRAPSGEIDHINGVRSDNSTENLRDVTIAVNRRNLALRSDNTSGVPGVVRKGGKWAATVCADGQRRWLGVFPNKEQAIAARLAVQPHLGFTERHGVRA